MLSVGGAVVGRPLIRAPLLTDVCTTKRGNWGGGKETETQNDFFLSLARQGGPLTRVLSPQTRGT